MGVHPCYKRSGGHLSALSCFPASPAVLISLDTLSRSVRLFVSLFYSLSMNRS